MQGTSLPDHPNFIFLFSTGFPYKGDGLIIGQSKQSELIITHYQICYLGMFNRVYSQARLMRRSSLFSPFRNCVWFSKVAQAASSAQEFIERTRNVAIIAHVDHGKTTLVDSLLRFGGIKINDECAMDSNQLQREKGITILSKATSIQYNNHEINIVDTPGHQDFGGEVERIMDMVDGVCLVVCATEGPMTQTKFVLKKALEQKVKPLVVINKVDRPTARISEVITEVFEMFCDLNCPDHFMDYPVYYASGKNGWAVENMTDKKSNIECILKGIIDYVPPPKVNPEKAFSMLVTQTQPNSFYGKMALGRINSGELSIGKELKVYDQDSNLIEMGKVTKIMKKTGLSQINLDKAYAGDIVLVSGFPSSRVTHTLVEEGFPEKRIPCLKIDEPLMGVSISVNTSPLAGKQGTKVALNDLKTRLKEEAENDVALTVITDAKGSGSVQVRGRGDLHIGILLEKLRRQGYEFSVTPPEIVYKKDEKGQLLEPIEKIQFQVEDRFTNLIMDKMNTRQGVYISSEPINDRMKLQFICSTRALIGIRTELMNETQGTALIKSSFLEYRPHSGPLRRNNKGAIISMCDGVTTPYILKEIQKFGTLFVKPGMKVYNGLVIGENNKDEDVEVNPTKEKKVTNVRTHSHDEKIMLVPPKIMSIEEAICYVRDDELLEVTPKEVRIRKKQLDQKGRERLRRDRKNELKNAKN